MLGVNEAVDSKGRALPRKMIRIQRTEPEEDVVRTEMRFVIYQSKKDIEEMALYEEKIIDEAMHCLMRKYTEMNSGQPLPQTVPSYDAVLKLTKARSRENVTKSSVSSQQTDKEWIPEIKTRLETLAKRVETIERSAALVGPEFAELQTHLVSLLTDLEKRKRAGASDSHTAVGITADEHSIREKLALLQQLAVRSAHAYMQLPEAQTRIAENEKQRKTKKPAIRMKNIG